MATDWQDQPQKRWEGFDRRLLNTVRCYPKLFFFVVLPLLLLIVTMVILQGAGVPLVEKTMRHEYCSRCGLVHASRRWCVANVTVSCSEEVHRTLITEWLEKRLGECTDHRWALAQSDGRTYELFGGITSHGGDGNQIWMPTYRSEWKESVEPLLGVLDKVEKADADRARQFAQSLLNKGQDEAWHILYDLAGIRNASPAELLDALNRIEAHHERQ